MVWCEQAGGVRELWTRTMPRGAVGLAWLGQAGFALRHDACRLFIDPHLSDFLAEKYRGQEFSHERLVPPPILPEEVRNLDWVLCSHRHSDHMDPGSLPILGAHNPRCRFMVPSAEKEAALKAGVPHDRMVGVNAGSTLPLAEGMTAQVIASAHEIRL